MVRSPSHRPRARRLTRLRQESLEPRQMLASDTWPASGAEAVPPDLPRLDQVAATRRYVANGTTIELVVKESMVALPMDAVVSADMGWLTERGWKAGRQLAGTSYRIFDVQTPLESSGTRRRASEGAIARQVPVFEVPGSGTELVLLDEAIVQLADGVAAATYFDGRPEFLRHRPLAGTSNQFVVTLSAGAGLEALDAIDGLAGDKRLAWVAPNFHQSWKRHAIPNDPRWSNLWHLQNTGQAGGTPGIDADLAAAWDLVPGGSTTLTIGVVDDGVATDHPDLTVWVNPGEIAGNGVDDDGNGWVDDVNGWNFVANTNVSTPSTADDNHGTSVAGVAAARGNNGVGVVGASSGTPVLSARIFAGSAVASDADIAAAIYYAAGRTRNGLGTWKAADICNHSWGGGAASTAISAAFLWATTQGRQGKGAAQLIATGNGYGAVTFPATESLTNPGVIAVGAVNNRGEKSDYSNYGAALDVVAPSDDARAGYLAIDTTDRVGTAGYNTAAGTAGDYTGTGTTGFGGTSSATPLATGVAALALARSQALGVNLSPSDLRSLLRATTRLVGSSPYDPATGRSPLLGFGLISAANLVRGVGARELSVLSPSGESAAGGSVSVGSLFVDDRRDTVFRIRNQGTEPLTLSGVSLVGAGFSIAAGPAATVLGLGEATTFVVRFSPVAAGSASGTVTIVSNDADEGTFSFTVQGVGTSISVSGVAFEDADGDGIRQSDETVLAGRRVFLDTNGNGIHDAAIEDVTVAGVVANPAIPDPGTTSSSAIVSGLAWPVTDVDVTVTIVHPWVADLDVVLVSPTGRRVVLASGVGGSGDNFTGTIFDDSATLAIGSGTPPFTGRFRPSESLDALAGSIANGTWTLEVSDEAPADAGSLVSWSIRIRTGEAVAVTGSGGLYTFVDLAPGTYAVGSLTPADWTATGATRREFSVTGPSIPVRGLDFGSGRNNRFYARVFDDADADGLQDAGEPGLPGRRVFHDLNGNGVIDSPTTATFTSSTSLPIVDLATGTSSLVVSGVSGLIGDVDVRVSINHTYVADLDVFLIAPDGTRVELFTDVGGSGDNFVNTVLDDEASTSITSVTSSSAPFTGRYRPEGSLASLDGRSGNGTWRLEITDDAGGDVGTLVSWSVILTSAADAVATTDASGRATLDLPAGAATVRHEADAARVPTLPATGTRTVTATGGPLFGQAYGSRQRPSLAVAAAAVSGREGEVATNSGSWGTPYAGDTLVLAASLGTIVRAADGTWSWSYVPPDQSPTTTVTITAIDTAGISSATSFSFTATNAAPLVSATADTVSGVVLQPLVNSGRWFDVAADTVTLSASLGTVMRRPDGSWSWTHTPAARLLSQSVTITAADEDGGSASVSFLVSARVAVADGRVYHKGSSFAAGGVEAALDPLKQAARPGATAGPVSFANIVSGSRGLNGLLIDVPGLVATGITTGDFAFAMSPTGAFDEAANPPSSWGTAPAPSALVVTPGTNTTPARVRLEWADLAIANRWLQVVVLSTPRTGLDAPEILYVGHLLGETTGGIAEGLFRVTNADLLAVASRFNAVAPVGSTSDVVIDGQIRGSDLLAVAGQVGRGELRAISIPVAGSGSHGTFVAARRGSTTVPRPVTQNAVARASLAWMAEAGSPVEGQPPVGRRPSPLRR